MEEIKRGARFIRAWSWWAAVGLLAVLCAVLAVLQYRWLGEISRAEQQRLKDDLTSKLTLLSRNFNREIENAARALIASGEEIETQGRETAYALNFRRWEATHERLFKHVALAIPADDSLKFEMLNPQGVFEPAEWPDTWSPMREHLLERLQGGGPPGSAALAGTVLFEFPRFGRGGREQEWLIVELNTDFVRSVMLPELLGRFLGDAGKLEYDAEVVETANPSNVIYRSLNGADHNSHTADASIGLLEIRPFGMGGRGSGPPDSRGPLPPPPSGGRWQLLVRHHSGSLESAVARARWRNIAVSAGILLLILATVGTLVRFSRKTQQLADLQMNFVAGVSHELRTPLTVMSTAAYNLRGKIAANPAQVERYGALFQEQCEKLGATVEQVLRFSSMKSGKIVRERAPVSIEGLIDEEIRTHRSLLERAACVPEVRVAHDLPVVLGDATALRHALQNLITNAVKYGCEGSNWIGVTAHAVDGPDGELVEIRVADRGPGIPADEQRHIFDPFFRGSRAIQDQIHGTGLGLNLVKRIVEAHGGTIEVESEPMKRTEFIVRLPAAPGEVQDEVAHSFG
jgi:signal transduction histidine kinase